MPECVIMSMFCETYLPGHDIKHISYWSTDLRWLDRTREYVCFFEVNTYGRPEYQRFFSLVQCMKLNKIGVWWLRECFRRRGEVKEGWLILLHDIIIFILYHAPPFVNILVCRIHPSFFPKKVFIRHLVLWTELCPPKIYMLKP